MGATSSRGRSIPCPFVAGEFTVAWLTFKSDAVEDANHRHVARKEGLMSSKLLRGLFGETTMRRFAEHDGEFISRELFICTLVLNYEGNTEDRISFIFTMYSIIYGMEREREGCINCRDYKALIEYWESFNPIPKKFYNVFEDCDVAMDGVLLNSQFIQWIRQYPNLMECLAHHLPPSQLGTWSPPSIQTSDEYIAQSDALNKSPSCRLDNDKLNAHLRSFDFIGGEDSGEDDSDEVYDSDQIPEDYANDRGSYESEEGTEISSAPITPSSIQIDPLTPTEGGDERVRRKRGTVQRGVRNISKTLNGGISKVGHVGRSILHGGKSSYHLDGHTVHTPTHLPTVLTPPYQPPDTTHSATGYSFSSESQISRNYVCGYLQKISDGKWSKRSWHRRWFVLDRQKSVLSYYRYNPANLITTTPRGTIVCMHETQDEVDENRKENSTPSLFSPQSDQVSTPTNIDNAETMNQPMLYLNTSHPWYRGALNLNMENVSLLFEKSMAKNAPTPFYFQVSTLTLGDIDSTKRGGIQYKLCAENEHEFDRWTRAIALAINKKQENPSRTVLFHQQLYRQRLLQEEQLKMQQLQETSPSPVTIASPNDAPPTPNVKSSSNVNPPVSVVTTTQPTPIPEPLPLMPKRSPRIISFTPSPKHLCSSSPWQLHLHVEGAKQCLILGFMVNIVTLKCIAAENAIIKVLVCIIVTCTYIFSVYTPKSTPSTRRRHSFMCKDSNVEANVFGADFPSLDMCLDRDRCCVHKSISMETTEINGNDGRPVSSHGITTLWPAPFAKFRLSSSMMRTEMNPTGKAGPIPQAWTTARAESFIVRSREYKKTKRKEPSQPALFEFLGADLVQVDSKVDMISQRIQVSDENANDKLFIINAQLPAYAPSVWASCDGPGYSLILVWKIPDAIVEELKEPRSKVIRLLKRFLEAGDDTTLTDRFKVIAQVVNQDECGLTGMAKKLLVSHNATPVLTRPQHRIYHFNNGSTEVAIDIHAFSYIARKGIHLLLDKTSKLVIDISFVLQGETEEELPEQILGCCRLDSVDVAQAMQLPP